MIQESVREMSFEERELLAGLLRPGMGGYRPYTIRPTAAAAVGCVVLAVLSRGAAGARIHDPEAWLARLFGMAAITSFWFAVHSLRRYLRVRRLHTHYYAHRHARLTRALKDGRVRVRRVSAVAVVAIEPVDDEGWGYLFDLGDGRVLFLKGGYLPDHDAGNEDEPWPCTELELVQRVADGGFVELACTGRALRPVRVIPKEQYDEGELWEERDEVLNMSLDDAVQTLLRHH